MKNKNNLLDYRELAELVLQRFGIDGMENLNDEELLMEFSKFSDDKTEFDTTTSYPSGNITKSEKSTRFEGIFWANRFAPEFVKVVINDNELLALWNRRKDIFIDRARRKKNFNYVDMIKMILKRKEIYNENKEKRLSKILNVANEIFVDNMMKMETQPNFLILLKELSDFLNYDINTMFSKLDISENGEVVIKN